MKKNQRYPENIGKTTHPPKDNRKWVLAGVLISALILVIYAQTFRFGFVNWDDDVNVYENRTVESFDVKGIFSDHVIGNYNPLTILTFAIEYKFAGETAPGWYHFNNVLLHLLCSLMVLALMRRLGLSLFASSLVALLFALHPMRVESVAWITERKDVLYSVFYLWAIHLYLSFRKSKKGYLYLLSLLVFVLSLLSKIQAVTLPLSLILIDFWLDKKFELKSVINKIPFFVLSLVTGLVGIYFLRQQGSLDAGETLPLVQRLFIGSYAFVVYIIKSLVPFEMAAVYPYPAKAGVLHYLSIIPAAAVVIYALLKYKTRHVITFGILFFTLNIIFLLQIVGAGQGFLADRFTYIAYIGLFFIYARFAEEWLKKSVQWKNRIYMVTGVYLFILVVISFNQTSVWKNGETLWTSVIEKEPSAAIAYNNLGHYYRRKNNYDLALKNYNIAISLKPEESKTYNNRGKIYFDQGKTDLALADYNKCLEIDPGFAEALSNRGAAYGALKEFDKALSDLSKAISIDPENSNALSNRALVYLNLKEYERCIADCETYLQIKPDDADIVNLLGLGYANLKNYETAIQMYNRAIRLDASKAPFFLNRSLAYYHTGDQSNALKDAQRAQQLGLKVNPSYMEALGKQ